MNVSQLASQYVYWPEIENKYQRNIDFSKTKVKEFIPLITDFIKQPLESVENSILKFYSLNETLNTIRQNNHNFLDEKNISLYQQYQKEIETLSQKIFVYLFTITLMESRYSLDIDEYGEQKYNVEEAVEEDKKESEKDLKEFKSHLLKSYSNSYNKKDLTHLFTIFDGINEIQRVVSNTDRIGTKKELAKHLPNIIAKNFGDITLGQYLNGLKTIFYYNNFDDGYGGDLWGDITEHLSNFVNGKINSEVFIDQSFSLEHNSGHIFNKSIIFDEPVTVDIVFANLDDLEINERISFAHQFLLNLQHKGQLSSFLNYNFKEDIDKISKIISQDKLPHPLFSYLYHREKQSFYDENEPIDEKQLENTAFSQLETLKDILISYEQIQKHYKKKNQSFLNELKEYHFKAPLLNIPEVLQDLKVNSERFESYDLLYLYPEDHDIFELLPQISKNNNKLKVKSFSFNFENIKNITNLNKNYLGNKALGLVDMIKDNLPVPEAIVFPTNNSQVFFQHKEKWIRNFKKKEKEILQSFYNPDSHFELVSIRSGSSISMPGMMDTILNVGIDDNNYDYLCEKMGKSVVDDCAIKFMTLFIKSKFNEHIKFSNHLHKALSKFKKVLIEKGLPLSSSYNLFPLNHKDQVRYSVEAVFNSWNSERAIAYRNFHDIPNDIGTAAIVQKMVFGNLNEKSCTGVLFSRDCISGKKGIIGEFLPKAQGEDVVSGAVTPLNISELKAFNPTAYNQLVSIAENLEKTTGDIQDIEFTIEDGNLYILQKRKAVCSSIAQSNLLKELVKENTLSEKDYIEQIKVEQLLEKYTIETEGAEVSDSGLVGNPGILNGIIVNNESDITKFQKLYDYTKRETNSPFFGWIFYAKETSPDHAPIMLKTDAFITENGGFTSHAAILARSWDKPCVVGIGNNTNYKSGDIVTLDAHTGKIYKQLLEIKKESNTHIKTTVKDILSYYNVDKDSLKNIDFPTLQINSWMEEFGGKLKPKEKKIKTDKFLTIGQKVALMLVLNNNKKKKGII